MKTQLDIIKKAVQAVEALTGIKFTQIPRDLKKKEMRPFDGVVQINLGHGILQKPYIIKPAINPVTIHLLSILQKESKGGILLVASFVNDRQGELLRSEGIHYIDMAGNVFIQAPGIHVHISGRRPQRDAVQPGRVRAFQPSGLRLLYFLLTDPNLDSGTPGEALVGKPYREISSVTGISHSTIGWVMADLIHQKLVVQIDSNTRILVDRDRILDRWVQGYIDRLRPRLVIGRYKPESVNWWQNATLEGGLWSGEVAAAMLTNSIKPGSFMIFGEPPSHAFILKHHLQKDPSGSVEILKSFESQLNLSPLGKNCVHPLLIYADLMSVDDDRTREVAQIIYDRYLHTLIQTA